MRWFFLAVGVLAWGLALGVVWIFSESGGALTFIAFLPPAPLKAEPPFLSFDWVFSPFSVMPIQMFNWTSRPEAAFHQNAAAAGFVLVLMTLAMNGLAIWLRYRLRKTLQW